MDADSASRLSPPLRVHHFLAWTAASVLVGVWLVGLQSLAKQSFPDALAASDTVRNAILSAVSMVATGGMLALSAYGIAWKVRDRSISWQPGMWLALFGTAEFLLLVTTIPYSLWGWGSIEHKLVVAYVVELPARAICMMAFLALAFRRDLTADWRATCGVFTFAQLIAILSLAVLLFEEFNGDSASLPGWVWTAFLAIPETDYFIMAFAVVAACGFDLIRRRQREWPHWAGASLWLIERVTFLW